MRVLSVLLLLCFVLAATARQGVDKKPLIVHATQHRRLANDLKAYHRQMRNTHKNYIPLYPDDPILTNITIGTPAVDYLVSLETGSEALFVLAKNYPGRSFNQPFFDPAQSSTAQLAGDFSGFSGDLEAFGAAYDDVVGLFGFGPEYNTTQRFGVVDEIYDLFSFDDPQVPDGVVGLSWNLQDAANPNENSSAIINLFRELGPDFERYWCQWMSSTTDPQYGREHQVITSFGGTLDGFCAPPAPENTVPLVWVDAPRTLAFQMDAFTYKNVQYDGGFGKVDTGVPNILMPASAFVAVFNDVQPDYDFEYNLYTVDCDKAGSLRHWEYTIGGQTYAIPSSVYVVDLLLPYGQCALSVFPADTHTVDYVFGYVFHNLWCVKMDIDNQAVSFMDVLPLSTAEPALN